MTVNEAIKAIYENAVNHGWHEKERPFYEVAALIHSELSEALEEARADRPMVWHMCRKDGETVCDGTEVPEWCFISNCGYKDAKPEGIAVELIDAVIRIFDYIGSENTSLETDFSIQELAKEYTPDEIVFRGENMTISELVNIAHDVVSDASRAVSAGDRIMALLVAAAGIMQWLILHDIDPEAVMIEKHAYNKTRQYRHGKRF